MILIKNLTLPNKVFIQNVSNQQMIFQVRIIEPYNVNVRNFDSRLEP